MIYIDIHPLLFTIFYMSQPKSKKTKNEKTQIIKMDETSNELFTKIILPVT